MLVIGLCGGSGSGKGTVSSFFSQFGIPSIDADAVYRDLTKPGAPLLSVLASEFGDFVIASDGSLDRKVLSELVFSDDSGKLRKRLNNVTHFAVISETEKRIDNLRKKNIPAVIFDAPLLFESGFDKKCDIIIAVVAPYEERIRRILERDSLDTESIKRRIASQIPDEVLKEQADYTIVNDGTMEKLSAEVKKFVEIIKNEVNKNE